MKMNVYSLPRNDAHADISRACNQDGSTAQAVSWQYEHLMWPSQSQIVWEEMETSSGILERKRGKKGCNSNGRPATCSYEIF
jgi:hypothetical protein